MITARDEYAEAEFHAAAGPRPAALLARLEELRARKEAALQAIAGARAVRFTVSPFVYVILHRGTRGEWRTTTFDAATNEPTGHMEFHTFEDAAREWIWHPAERIA